MRSNNPLARFSLKFIIVAAGILNLNPLHAQQKFESGPEGRVQNSNHFSLGAGAELGAAFVKDAEDSGIAYQGYVETGYTQMIDPWSIAEFSLRLSTGTYRWEGKNNDEFSMPVNIGVLAQVGYGRALSKNMFGVFNIGAGAFMATLEQKIGSLELESDSAELGLNARASGGLRFVLSPYADFTTGVALDWKKIDLDVRVPLLGIDSDFDVSQWTPNVFVSARIKV